MIDSGCTDFACQGLLLQPYIPPFPFGDSSDADKKSLLSTVTDVGHTGCPTASDDGVAVDRVLRIGTDLSCLETLQISVGRRILILLTNRGALVDETIQ